MTTKAIQLLVGGGADVNHTVTHTLNAEFEHTFFLAGGASEVIDLGALTTPKFIVVKVNSENVEGVSMRLGEDAIPCLPFAVMQDSANGFAQSSLTVVNGGATQCSVTVLAGE